LFTDAIIEAESESGEYGLDRLVEEVTGSSLDARALSHRILQSVQQFAAGRRIADDLTLVIADL
jgi:serine phosphatase RsbU (regulator of sigma subunit)